MSLTAHSPPGSPQPVAAAPAGVLSGGGQPQQFKTPAAQRKCAQRYRRRLLAELWAGTSVRAAKPGESCPWGAARCATEGCRAGEPCKHERRMRATIQNDAAARFGSVLGNLVTDSVLDLARETAAGHEDGIRQARVKLLDVLARDANQRRGLALQARRLRLEEGKARPEGPSLMEYVSQRYPPAAAAAPPCASEAAEAPEIPTDPENAVAAQQDAPGEEVTDG